MYANANGDSNTHLSANGTKHEGTRESPIALLSDAEDSKPNKSLSSSANGSDPSGLKRKTSQETSSPKKKRKVIEIVRFKSNQVHLC